MSDSKVPVTELVSFHVKEGLKPGEGQEKMFGIKAAYGFQGGRYGWQVEDKATFHWTLDWESLDAHKAMMATPEYGPFVGELLKWSSPPSLFHAALSPHPPTPAFTSPVTEVAKLYVGPELSKEDWLKGFAKFEEGLKVAPGYKAHSSGWSVEDEKCYVLAIGWESVEAHLEWKKTEGGVTSINHLRNGLEKSEMWHIRDEGAVTQD